MTVVRRHGNDARRHCLLHIAHVNPTLSICTQASINMHHRHKLPFSGLAANLTPGWGIHWLNMKTHPCRKKPRWPLPEMAKRFMEALIVPGSNGKPDMNGVVPGSSVPLIFWCSPCSDAPLSRFHEDTQKSGSHEHVNMDLHTRHSRASHKFRHSVYFPDIWGLKSKFIHWHNHPLNAGWGIKLPLMFPGLQTGLTTIVIFVA